MKKQTRIWEKTANKNIEPGLFWTTDIQVTPNPMSVTVFSGSGGIVSRIFLPSPGRNGALDVK